MEDRFVIGGRTVPYRPDNPIVTLGEIRILDTRLEVLLTGSPTGPLTCNCEIWEHTVYELELLSSSLRFSAREPFPPDCVVERPEGKIGISLNLPLAASIEVGYSLVNPGAKRAEFFCSSNKFRSRDRDRVLGVLIGLAIGGGFDEVVVEPEKALELADWIDGWLDEMWDESEHGP